MSGKSACATRKPGEEPDRCQIIFQSAPDRGPDDHAVKMVARGALMLEVMNRLARAYASRRILVTGGASFIGSHLSELLSGST